MTSTPHDALFKATFSSPRMAAELLRPLLGPALAGQIDWDSLTLVSESQIDQALQAMHADLLFAARMNGREIRIFLLLEHQSAPDRWIALWLLRYMTNIWVGFVEEHKAARRLPPILPVVIHHGEKAWTIDSEFSTLVECADLPALQRMTPKFRFALADLNTVDAEDLRCGPGSAEVRLTLLALKEARAAENVMSLLSRCAVVLNQLEREPDGVRAIERVIGYFRHVRGAEEFEGIDYRRLGLGKTSEAIMETSAEYLLRKGKETGLQEGLQEGHASGNRTMFLSVLRARFGDVPPAVVARVETADVDRLTRWVGRAVSAATIDEVFAD